MDKYGAIIYFFSLRLHLKNKKTVNKKEVSWSNTPPPPFITSLPIRFVPSCSLHFPVHTLPTLFLPSEPPPLLSARHFISPLAALPLVLPFRSSPESWEHKTEIRRNYGPREAARTTLLSVLVSDACFVPGSTCLPLRSLFCSLASPKHNNVSPEGRKQGRKAI